MRKKLTTVMALLCLVQVALAQVNKTEDEKNAASTTDESAFTFTEAQLGEDDDMAQNVTILGSSSNLYASQVGYAFSPVRFRYRAFSQKYNDIYINGMQMNDMETGQFRFSLVGGLNNQTRSVEYSLPFEDNLFSLSGMGGSNNYNFRAGSMATGHRASVAGANRNYTLRGMYTYNSGFNNDGWAWSASVTYRWADYKTAYVQGTFYNALSYFFGVEKILNDNHHLSFSTWGNPTERAGQGGATDESYWLANSNFYNPYWGYQGGKMRNSRIVNDFAPSALFTWDWKISDKAKLTTTLGGRYSMYKSTKLNYNNSDNPQPDYWKRLPSAYYDVWNPGNNRNDVQPGVWASEFNQMVPEYWYAAYTSLAGSEANRQINWDRLYASNLETNKIGNPNLIAGQVTADQYAGGAMYFIQAKRNDALTMQLNSILNMELSNSSHLTAGIGLGSNSGRHYQTMEDLLGANYFYNLNTYAASAYGYNAPEVRYDLNNNNLVVKEGDVFGYDYYLNIRKANAWAAYTKNLGRAHFYVGAKTSFNAYQRDGKMQNGMAKRIKDGQEIYDSYGKSRTATFGDGGGKAAISYNLGKGHAVSLGVGYELRAPQASMAFAAPEINNDFVTDLHNEKVFSSEFSYQMKMSRVALNLSAYYTRITDGTEWQNFYFDDENSFTYVSMTDVKKAAYGIEGGLKVKLTGYLDFKAMGTISEAKYTDNAKVRYMMSTGGEYDNTSIYSKDMRESGTPLTATSLGFAYHMNGWFIDLSANWYDRIYLSWSMPLRYESTLKTQGMITTGVDENGNIVTKAEVPAQSMGHGGWMVDGSIGKNMYLKKGSLSINLSLTNILNNVKICTGGYEQARQSYTVNNDGSMSGTRTYDFYRNTKKYYAYGTNGMLNVTYKF